MVFSSASASGPSSNRIINYQLRLTDPSGIPVADGTKNVKISFYDAASGGTRLHTDCGTTATPEARNVNFTNGLATVLIGAGSAGDCDDVAAPSSDTTPNAIPATLFNNTTLYLGITLESDAEMTPRKRVVATGYSLNADRLDDMETSKDGGVTESLSAASYIPATDTSGNFVLSKNVTVDTNTFFVDATNNRVGIGTTSPQQALHVVGNPGEVIIENSNGVAGLILHNNNNGVDSAFGATAGVINFTPRHNSSQILETASIRGTYQGDGTTRSGDMFFSTGRSGSPARRLTITSGGDIGTGGIASKFSSFTIKQRLDFTALGTTTASATTTIAGSGTRFLTEIGIGDRIALSSAPATYATVVTITNDTSLTVNAALGNGTSQTIGVKKGILRIDDQTDATKMFVDDLGNVGIGTFVPAASLEVQKTLGSAAEAAFLVLDSDNLNTGAGSSIQFKNNNATGAGYFSAIAGIDDGGDDGRLEFRVSNNGVANTTELTSADTAMTIKQSGNVGIGATSPLMRLHVRGGTGANDGSSFDTMLLNNTAYGANATAQMTFDIGEGANGAGFGASIAAVDTGSFDTRLDFRTRNNSAHSETALTSSETRMTIDTNGNVGIGTTAPSTLLHLVQNTNGAAELRAENPNTGTSAETVLQMRSDSAAINFQAFSSTRALTIGGISAADAVALRSTVGLPASRMFVGTGTAVPLYLITNDAVALTVDSSQNVGIADTTPTEGRLVVASSGVVGYFNSTDTSGTVNTVVVNNTGGSSGLPVVEFREESTEVGSVIGHNAAEFGLVNGINLSSASGRDIGFRINNLTEAARITTGGRFTLGTSGAQGMFTVQSSQANTVPVMTLSGTTPSTPASFQWTPATNERVGLLTGSTGSGSYGTMAVGTNQAEAAANVLGAFAFVQAQSGKTNPDGYSGVKASIEGRADGSGGATAGFGGAMLFNTRADNSSYGERMRITNSGRVGIGVTNPNNTIQVASLINFHDAGLNTFLGKTAGAANTGLTNTGVGYEAMGTGTGAGNANTALGYAALYKVTGADNVGIGSGALFNTTSGSRNIGIGTDASITATTAIDNVAIGYRTLRFTTSGGNNIAIGREALSANTTGSNNIGIGTYAVDTATASNNIGIGYQALTAADTGTQNIGIGTDVLLANTSGSYNLALGGSTLASNLTGSNNVALGYRSMNANTASNLVAVGYASMELSSSGTQNTAVGYQAMNRNTTGSNNVALGYNALYFNQTGTGNVAIGTEPIFGLTGNSADYNIGIGYRPLYANTTGGSNIAIGAFTLDENTTGGNNVAIGYAALTRNVSTIYNVAVGSAALQENLASGNTAVGHSSLTSNTSGTNNVAVGLNALQNITTTGGNTVVGAEAMQSNSGGSENVAIGYLALRVGSTTNNNVAVGRSALDSATTASNNVAIGYDALTSNSSGTDNVGIGYLTGAGVTTGTNITLVGRSANVSDGTITNATAIGGSALVDCSNCMVLGNTSTNVGIGLSNPAAKLNVKDTSAFSGNLVHLEATGAATGNMLNITSTSTSSTAKAINIDLDNGNSNNDVFVITTDETTVSGSAADAAKFRINASGAIALTSGYNQLSGTFSLTSATATGNIMAVTDTALTTGSLINFTSTNNSAANTAWSANKFNVTNTQGTIAVSTGSIVGLDLQFTQNAAVAGNTETAARINLAQIDTSVTDNTVSSLLDIANNDTVTGNQVTVTDGLKITGTNITNGLNFSGTFDTNLITSPIFKVLQSGAIVGNTFSNDPSPSTSGHLVIQPENSVSLIIFSEADTTSKVLVQNSIGATVFDIDTSNKRVGIAATTPTSTLDVTSTEAGTNALTITNTALTTGQSLKINAGNFTDDSGRALYIDTTEATSTSDIILVETDFSTSNNQVFKVEADGEAFSDVGFTAGAFSTKFYDGSIESTGAFSINTTSGQAVTVGAGGLTVNGALTTAAGQSTNFDSNTLYIDAANDRVGIGTATPNEQLQITGNFRLPPTTATTGIIKSGTNRYIHNFGTDNFFAGVNAGNLTLTGQTSVGVGVSALSALTDGQNNVAVGYSAMTSTTSGLSNVAIGAYALNTNSTGSQNVAIGHAALYAETTGNNTAVGYLSQRFFDTGTGNVSLGTESMRGASGQSTGDQNTALGYQAGYALTSGAGNSLVGYSSGDAITTGTNNVGIGNSAAGAMTTGADNVAVGANALDSLTTTGFNVAVGREAQKYFTTNNNTAVGYRAMYGVNGSSTGNDNVAVGREALLGLTSGTFNTVMGNYAGKALTTANYNLALGHNALFSETTGGENMAIGHDTMYYFNGGIMNVAIGGLAMLGVNGSSTGDFNVAVGEQALNGLTTGSSNVAVGMDAGLAGTAVTTGSNNVFVGYQSGMTGSGAFTNATAIGYRARVGASSSMVLGGTGADAVNVGIGTTTPSSRLTVQPATTTASTSAVTVSNGTFDSDLTGWTVDGGFWAWSDDDGQCPSAGSNGCAYHAASSESNSISQTLSGIVSGTSYQITVNVRTTTASTGSPLLISLGTVDSAAIGKTVGTLTSHQVVLTAAASGSVALTFNPNTSWAGSIDSVTVSAITSTSSSITLNNSDGTAGVELRSGGTGLNNVFIGRDSGENTTTGSGNIGVGYLTLFANTTGYQNVGIGLNALAANTGGITNVAVGVYAMASNTGGYGNVAIGEQALTANLVGADNTAIGKFALSSSIDGGTNTAVGAGALQSSTASGNVGLGGSAGVSGTAITSGSNNTFLGTFAGSTSATRSKGVAIGYNSRVGCDNCLSLGGTSTDAVNVGIETTTPTAKLEIGGTAPEVFLNGSTSNMIRWNGNGVAGPAFTTRSAGTKLVLWPNITGSTTDYAIGVESGSVWYSSDGSVSSGGHKFYGGTTLNAKSQNDGLFGVRTLGGASASDLCYDTTTISGLNTLTTCSSSIRYKEDVRPLEVDIDRVLGLRPVNFKWKDRDERSVGFIAEEVAELIPEIITYKDGQIEGVQYKLLAPYMIEILKRHHADIAKLPKLDELGDLALGGALKTTMSGFAQMLPSTDALEPGELVVVDATTGGVRRAVGEKGDGFLMAGAVADKAGFVAGASDETGQFPVVMSGRVSVRIVGPIEIGDPIALSLTPGVGIKAEEASYIVGIALDQHEGPGPGFISLLVRPGWFNGTAITVANTETSNVETTAPVTDIVDFKSQKLIGIGAIEGAGQLWSVDVEGRIFAKELTVDKIRVKQIEVEQTSESQSAGEGVIPVGSSSVTIENPLIKYNSRVFVTFYGNTEGGWWISQRQDGKFEVTLAKPAPTDLKFEYLILSVVDNRPAPAPVTETPPETEPTEPDTDTVPDAQPITDTDADGLSDEEETVTYGTDPANPDTDGDSYLDGQEVVGGHDPLSPASSVPEAAPEVSPEPSVEVELEPVPVE